MDGSTLAKGAAVVGGISLLYWLTRKKDDATELHGDEYEVVGGDQAVGPLPNGLYFDDSQAFCSEERGLCDVPNQSSYTPTPPVERPKRWHAAYNHYCYEPDPNTPFENLAKFARESGQCERRLHSFSPSWWTEAQVDEAGKQLVC